MLQQREASVREAKENHAAPAPGARLQSVIRLHSFHFISVKAADQWRNAAADVCYELLHCSF